MANFVEELKSGKPQSWNQHVFSFDWSKAVFLAANANCLLVAEGWFRVTAFSHRRMDNANKQHEIVFEC